MKDAESWMPGADGRPVERFDDTDVEKLARILHETGPLIERQLFGAPVGYADAWDRAPQLTQEGQRIRARYLLDRNLIHLKALRA